MIIISFWAFLKSFHFHRIHRYIEFASLEYILSSRPWKIDFWVVSLSLSTKFQATNSKHTRMVILFLSLIKWKSLLSRWNLFFVCKNYRKKNRRCFILKNPPCPLRGLSLYLSFWMTLRLRHFYYGNWLNFLSVLWKWVNWVKWIKIKNAKYKEKTKNATN